MTVTIHGVDVQALVAQAFPAGSLPEIKLRQYAVGARNPAALSGGPAYTSTDYVTRGVEETFSLRSVDNAPLVQAGDRLVMLIGQPLDTIGIKPRIGDEIVLADGTVLRVVWVPDRDPCVATYEVYCRG